MNNFQKRYKNLLNTTKKLTQHGQKYDPKPITREKNQKIFEIISFVSILAQISPHIYPREDGYINAAWFIAKKKPIKLVYSKDDECLYLYGYDDRKERNEREKKKIKDQLEAYIFVVKWSCKR